MAVKMSLAQALKELKLLQNRINSGITKGKFIFLQKATQKIEGIFSKEEAEAVCKADLQSIADLIQFRNKLKQAITTANATTKVTIGEKVYTIAEAIDSKAAIEFKKLLLQRLVNDLKLATSNWQSYENDLGKRIDALLAEAFKGKDKSKISAEEQEAIVKPYRENNEVKIIDPLNLANIVKTMEEEILEFETQVDYKLSEINAITFIEV